MRHRGDRSRRFGISWTAFGVGFPTISACSSMRWTTRAKTSSSGKWRILAEGKSKLGSSADRHSILTNADSCTGRRRSARNGRASAPHSKDRSYLFAKVARSDRTQSAAADGIFHLRHHRRHRDAAGPSGIGVVRLSGRVAKVLPSASSTHVRSSHGTTFHIGRAEDEVGKPDTTASLRTATTRSVADSGSARAIARRRHLLPSPAFVRTRGRTQRTAVSCPSRDRPPSSGRWGRSRRARGVVASILNGRVDLAQAEAIAVDHAVTSHGARGVRQLQNDGKIAGIDTALFDLIARHGGVG